MAIVKTVYFSDFCDAFVKADRENNFSYEGKKALFQYLEELSEDDYSEIARNYRIALSDCEDEEEIIEAVRKYLGNKTSTVSEDDGVFVYAVF